MSDKNVDNVALCDKIVPNRTKKITQNKENKKMNKVNLGDKYTHRITLRLNDGQYDFLMKVSNLLGVTPSDYLRMVVNTGMVSTHVDIDRISEGKTIQGMVGMNENVKADINDKL